MVPGEEEKADKKKTGLRVRRSRDAAATDELATTLKREGFRKDIKGILSNFKQIDSPRGGRGRFVVMGR